MRELLFSGIRRYRRSFVFWAAVTAVTILAAVCGYGARIYYVNLYYVLAALVTDAIMVSWHVGREYEEGIFRNKVISGHSKGKIYLSELILSVAASLVLYLIYTGIFFCFNGYLFACAPADSCIKIFLGLLAASICIPSIFVTVSCLICSRAAVVAINLVLISIALLLPSGIQKRLCEPEYISYSINEVWNGMGNAEVTSGKEIMTRNIDYVEDPLRGIMTAVYHASPCVCIIESFSLTYNWFGYELANRIDPLHEQGLTWEGTTDFTISEDENRSLAVSILSTCVESLVVCCLGYLAFRKKDLK